MALTQTEIDNLLQQFIGQYAGQRPDYYGYAGECLSLAKRWFDVLKNGHLNGQMLAPPSANWGSDYWVSPPGSVLELFDRQNYDPNATYPQGSLFVNTGSHHIGIMLSNNPGSTTATVFEQNADPDGSAAHSAQRAKNRIDGILVIKAYVAQPAPARTPKDYMQYSAVPAKTMRVNKLQTNWWNLSNDSDNIDNFQVATTLTVNTPFPIGGYAKNMHFPMYTYAMSPDDFNRAVNGDYSTNNGINLDDLEDIPYTPPAAPLPVPKVDYYDLKTTVVYFKSAEDAQKDQNGVGPLNKGTYVLLKSDGNARQITKNNAATVSYWINDLDNKIEQPIIIAAPASITPVVPANIQPTLPVDAPKPVIELVNDTSVTAVDKPVIIQTPFEWLKADHSAVNYVSTNTTTIKIRDLDGNFNAIDLPPRAKVRIAGIVYKDGREYGLDERVIAGGYRNAIPMSMLNPVTVPNRLDYNRDGRVDIQDVVGIGSYIETESRRAWASSQRLIRDIAPIKVYNASKQARQFIDGFKSRSKR